MERRAIVRGGERAFTAWPARAVAVTLGTVAIAGFWPTLSFASNPCAAAQELAKAGRKADALAAYLQLLKSKPVPACARAGVNKRVRSKFNAAGALLHAGFRAEALKEIEAALQLAATPSTAIPPELRRYLIAERTFDRVRGLDKAGFHEAAADALSVYLSRARTPAGGIPSPPAGGIPSDLRPLLQGHNRPPLYRLRTWIERETGNGKTLLWVFLVLVGSYLVLRELLRRVLRPRVAISPFSGAEKSGDDELGTGFAVELQSTIENSGDETGGTRPDLTLPGSPAGSLPASVTAAFPPLNFFGGLVDLVNSLIPSRDKALTGHLHPVTAEGVGASLVFAREGNGRIIEQVMLRQRTYGPVPPNGNGKVSARDYAVLHSPASYWLREVVPRSWRRRVVGAFSEPEPPWQAKALFAAGARLQEAGNADHARRLYTESLGYAPPIPDVLINLGGIEMKKGSADLDLYEVARGIAHLEQGVVSQVKPNWYRGNYLLAVAYANVAQAREADPKLQVPDRLRGASMKAEGYAFAVATALESKLIALNAKGRRMDHADHSLSQFLEALEPTILLLLAGIVRRWDSEREASTDVPDDRAREWLLEGLEGNALTDDQIVTYVSRLQLDYRARYNFACYLAGQGDELVGEDNETAPDDYKRAFSELKEALSTAPPDLVDWAQHDLSLATFRSNLEIGPEFRQLIRSLTQTHT
jgi:tetratricopeptide (TPR) repeat protein